MEHTKEFQEFLEKAEAIKDGFLFAMFTDHIALETWPLEGEKKQQFREGEGKLLEVRVFCEQKEVKLSRGDIGKAFFAPRVIDDTAEEREYFEEYQYLDIDEKRSKELFEQKKCVRATGGGIYHLPLENYKNAQLCIHNYFKYYTETGQAYISDWRLAGFVCEGRK